MVKKTEAKTTKTTMPKQGPPGRAPRTVAPTKKSEPETATSPAASAEPNAHAAAAPLASPLRERDARLPPAGTVLQKRDRSGHVRCEALVEEAGIRYKGTLYRSLSAAAMAAAKDLGLESRSQNGYIFFGLSKPPRHDDSLAALGRAWERYRARAAAVVGATKDDERDRVRDVLGAHADALKELRERVG